MPNVYEKWLSEFLHLPSWKCLYNPEVYWKMLSGAQRKALHLARTFKK